MGNSSLLAAATATVDDRNMRHITHDSRLIPASLLRRRFEQLGINKNLNFHLIFMNIVFSVKKEKKWESSNLTIHDDSVLALVSHAAEERLKYLIERIKSVSQQRTSLALQVIYLYLKRA